MRTVISYVTIKLCRSTQGVKGRANFKGESVICGCPSTILSVRLLVPDVFAAALVSKTVITSHVTAAPSMSLASEATSTTTDHAIGSLLPLNGTTTQGSVYRQATLVNAPGARRQ